MRLAVDVVLLPPKEIKDLALKLNAQLDDELRFGKECLPHISLCMGVMEPYSLHGAFDHLKEIAGRTPPLTLQLTTLHQVEVDGKTHLDLTVSRTPQLQRLHEEAMMIKEIQQEVATREDFLGDVGIRSVIYVSNFGKKYAYMNFYPHISLGFGKKVAFTGPVKFTVDKIAICHLGDRNTCKKVLVEAKLTG